MASLCTRIVLSTARRSIYSSAARCAFNPAEFPDPLDLATGLEKKELLAHLAGNDNPYDMNVQKRGPGTKDAPNLVASAFDSRLVGCICEEDATSINWMWLHEGSPRRCECGHWFKLVHKAPL